MLKAYIREVLMEMSTRYKRETGENLPRWKERLMQYADSGEHFVHFSFYPKLGLNPLNNFDTPTGFYAYPLQRGQISDFAVERPYAIVVSLNNSGNFLRLSDYTENDLQRDTEVLQDEFGLTREMEAEGHQGARLKTPGGILWNITRLLSNSRGEAKRAEKNPAWTKQREDHYEELLWIAQMFVGRSESERQTVIDEFLQNSRKPKMNRRLREKWRRLYNLAKVMPADATPAEIKRQADTQRHFTVNPRAGSWTSILRRLGYDGVIDNGESIIHPSEPFQGVFFSTGDLNLVDVINKGASSDIGELSKDEEELNFENMWGYIFSEEVFTGKISPSALKQSEFEDCTFQGVDFSGTVANGCKFVNCTFVDCNLKDAAFHKCLFSSCLVENPVGDLSTLSLSGSNIGGLRVLPTNTIMPKGYKLNGTSGQVVKG